RLVGSLSLPPPPSPPQPAATRAVASSAADKIVVLRMVSPSWFRGVRWLWATGRYGAGADREGGPQQQVVREVRRVEHAELGQEQPDDRLADLLDRLGHAGELDAGQGGRGGVVEAHHGDVVTGPQAALAERPQHSVGAQVAHAHHRR